VEEEEWVARGRIRGPEKKTSVGGVGGGGFSIHRCGGDGWADGVVPRRGVEPMMVEAVGDALVWTCWRWRRYVDSVASRSARENLAACRRQVEIL
jgi:hypothetical protein